MDMSLEKKKQIEKWVILFLVFVFYFIIATYKLTHCSLWFDEAIEYWYSKIILGPVPGGGTTSNMYERIVSTFQPPLYNIIMYLWLKIGDSEWWFRFFGVIMGFLGAIGIYKSVNTLSNYRIASIAVIIYSTTYRIIQYIQECAEYNLMLACLCWMLYFYICVLKYKNLKSIVLSFSGLYNAVSIPFTIPRVLYLFSEIMLSSPWAKYAY